MDPYVLSAQRWVNATYRGVTGFNPIAEDGQPGLATMYALTRALQHELGITALSNTFGPATLAGLSARGGILVGDTNTNIVKLLQCACFCKGYSVGGITGVLDSSTAAAVNAMMSDAGLATPFGAAVPPKVVKAMMTMDAYILLPRGVPAVRDAQRWLNGRYTTRSNFFVIACDGLLTPAIEKALYTAIQYEQGQSDSQVDGVFGPGSKSGLSSHTLTAGSTGVWVNLFTASMLSNRVALPGGGVYATFTDTFDAALVTAVTAFQTFNALPATGNGDYATWCQLLVSNGDPTRPATGYDGITTITAAKAKALQAAGCRIVGRYLDDVAGGGSNRRIQPGELAAIFGAGLRVFPVSEYAEGSASYYTYTRGFQHGVNAHTAAAGYGFGLDTVIYFAIDYDATDDDITNAIIPYFIGVLGGLASQGKRYIAGAYGCRAACAALADAGLTRWSFTAGICYLWNGNVAVPLPNNWSFNQIQTLTVSSSEGSFSQDRDVWRAGTDPGAGAVGTPPSSVDDVIAYLGTLHDLAVSYGAGNAAPDQVVLQYLRHNTHRDEWWAPLLGPVDPGFVAHVAAAGVPAHHAVVDPGTGQALHLSRIAAACQGALRQPASQGTGVGAGDAAGWAGNWMTFYGEWRSNLGAYPTGSDFCQRYLAQSADTGTFNLRDLVEAADGYLLATAVAAGASIAAAAEAHYRTGGWQSRMTRFVQGRFGDAETARTMAADALLTATNPALATLRNRLIQTTGGVPTTTPDQLATADLDAFCQGLASTLAARLAAETTSATTR